MSESENPQDGSPPDRDDSFQELTPSGRLRSRQRKHSGPYDAPIPEAADLNAMRIDWRTGQPVEANPPAASAVANDPAKVEELVRRVASELGMTGQVPQPSVDPNYVAHGDHPADRIPPPLPASLAVLNRRGMLHESTGKRKRKREHGSSGRRHCPFCQHNRAQPVRPTNPLLWLLSIVGIRTYSCRNCHNQFLAFSFVEGPYFTWKQVGVVFLIVLLMILAGFFVAPMFNRVPELPSP
jgi:hypothetical protein